MQICIGGYYGYGSLGDEAVLSCLIKNIRLLYYDSSITVLTASPQKTKILHGVKCVYRYNIPAVAAALSRSDIFILGGGTLLQDATSRRSLFYYMELIHISHLMGTPVYLLANGIGPITDKKLALSALKKCKKISLRDKDSYNFLLNEAKSYDKINLSCDPFFTVKPADDNAVYSYMTEQGIYEMDYFTVNVRKCRGSKQINSDALLYSLLPHISSGLKPIFVSMQDSCDLKLCESLAKTVDGYCVSPKNAEILAGIQKHARFSIGMRLHFLISSVITGTPTIALSYDKKVESVLDYTADLSTFDAFSFSPEELQSAIEYSMFFPPHPDLDTMQKLCLRDITVIEEIVKFPKESAKENVTRHAKA
ncbi:MAG: polysaccharide pyruvyl transferase CsaB [Clostridia bacterium]|nr:polysaccharide pyruvyl transferase CsaB [Clostridia bacterium]